MNNKPTCREVRGTGQIFKVSRERDSGITMDGDMQQSVERMDIFLPTPIAVYGINIMSHVLCSIIPGVLSLECNAGRSRISTQNPLD